MEAKEMFEKLGFEQVKTPYNETLICYRTNENYFNREIKFWLDDKLFYNNLVYGDYHTMAGSCPVHNDLLQAINQQCKELGWIE